MLFMNGNVSDDFDISFQDELVVFVSSHRHLGITFHSNGKFKTKQAKDYVPYVH